MLPSGPSLGLVSAEIIRNDIFQPASLGFIDQATKKEVYKTDIPTIIDDNLKLLSNIRLPDHLERSAVDKFFRKRIRKDLEKDPLHKSAVRISNYANDFYNKMERYFEEIFDYHDEVKKDILNTVFAVSKLYVNSDMPPSLIRSLTLAALTESRFLDVFNSRIRRERLKLIIVRNNRLKFRKICDEHNSWVDTFGSFVESVENALVRLIWYVDLNNCKTVKEIFKDKEIKKSALDNEYFWGLLIDLQHKTEEARQYLIQMGKEAFEITVDREDPTVNTLCKVMEIMGS